MINFKKLKFYVLLILAIISVLIFVFPFFGGYNPENYRAMLESFRIPQLLYMGWVALATATTLPISAAMVAGIAYFSFSRAMLYSCIAIVSASIATYYVAKFLGKGFVREDYQIKSKKKIHLFNQLMHEHSRAYAILLSFVYVFPSNLSFMLAGITGIPFLQFIAIVVLGNISTAFAVGLIILGVLNLNVTYVLGGAAFLLAINIIPIVTYYPQMKKLVLLVFNEKAYHRFIEAEKVVVKLEKIEKKIRKRIK
jgi:uncharacterized membrane protein YdjX (TVP38/TMEM64 family)